MSLSAKLSAADHGGDSDSTASIAGNILGLIDGIEAIPEELVSNLQLSAIVRHDTPARLLRIRGQTPGLASSKSSKVSFGSSPQPVRLAGQRSGSLPLSEEVEMKCSIQGCPGGYNAARITHTVRRGSDIVVFEHVPAELCSVCGDILLLPETMRHLEELLSAGLKPDRTAPVFEYA